jgi:hypothetical protein
MPAIYHTIHTLLNHASHIPTIQRLWKKGVMSFHMCLCQWACIMGVCSLRGSVYSACVYVSQEAADGRTAHSNGRNGANGLTSNTWKPCLMYFMLFHSNLYHEPLLPHWGATNLLYVCVSNTQQGWSVEKVSEVSLSSPPTPIRLTVSSSTVQFHNFLRFPVDEIDRYTR